MRASTWIKKNSTSPIETEKAIQLLNRSIAVYQLGSDNTKQSYIRQLKDSLKNSDLYAEHYTIAAKAFLKYYSL